MMNLLKRKIRSIVEWYIEAIILTDELIYEGCCVIRSRLLAIPTVVKLALFIQKT
jgi:hypothetical protein